MPVTHRFRRRRHRGRRQHVVDELHGLAEARPLAENKNLADHFQRRLDRNDIRMRPGDHHGERALFRAAHAAAYRAVDLDDVARA